MNHPGNLHWQLEDHPSGKSVTGHRAQDMHWHSGVPARHLVVSLKNASRLEALLGWLKADPASMKKMRIVIIDDEADQGGINTKDVSAEERTTINSLIIALANIPAQSVNYVAYTATPAANFLNESPGPKTLYPEDFIVSLPQSDEHFGSLQIFGAPQDGYNPLEIVRDVSQDDLAAVSALHSDSLAELPASLRQAVIWFLCSVSAMRCRGFRKPVTMLIHTSQRQMHHKNVGEAVSTFLGRAATNLPAFLVECEAVWNEVQQDLDQELFAERFPLYGRLTELQGYLTQRDQNPAAGATFRNPSDPA